jgi:DNA mismatch repair ATPase MutL
METLPRKLHPLDQCVANKIKGQTVAPNVVSAIVELIMNSVDAGCTTVDIRIDLIRWSIQVKLVSIIVASVEKGNTMYHF